MRRLDRSSDRVRFTLRVSPRAPRNEIVGWNARGELKVRIAAPPVDDRANEELVAFLATTLEVSRAQVKLLSGSRGRSKVIEVPSRCENRLSSFPEI